MNVMHYNHAMFSRVPIQLRIAPGPLKQVDSTAKNYDMTRADVMRACLLVAFNNWDEVLSVLDAKSEQM